MLSNKITAIRLANLSEQADTALDNFINYENLIIHTAQISEGEDQRKAYFQQHRAIGHVKIARVIEDGPYVAVHFRLTTPDRTTVHLEVYKFDRNGKLTEIWKNVQDEARLSREAGDMLAGSAQIKDLHHTELNRDLTNQFYQELVNAKSKSKLHTYINIEELTLHPIRPVRKWPIFDIHQHTELKNKKLPIEISYELCVCEGNFSLAGILVRFAEITVSVFELNRWVNSKIVENWQVAEMLPDPQVWNNNSSKFNFFGNRTAD